jgi:hypothetical protein
MKCILGLKGVAADCRRADHARNGSAFQPALRPARCCRVACSIEPGHAGAAIADRLGAAKEQEFAKGIQRGLCEPTWDLDRLDTRRIMRTGAVVGVIVAGLALAPEIALAGHLKPGMWKMTTAIDLGASVPQIPPEQLARLQSMGIKVPAPGQGITTQQCLTPDMAARDAPPHIGRNDSGCISQNEKVSASSMSADLVCSGTMKGQGAMQMTFADQEHYTGLFTFKGISSGHPVDLKSTFTGERISGECK